MQRPPPSFPRTDHLSPLPTLFQSPGGLHLHARRNGGLMRLLSRLIPRSITGQITGLVAVSVLLGLGLVATSLLVFFEPSSSDPATRMANLTLLVNAAERPDQAAAIVASAQRAGLKGRHVA